jgi:hypothetical protein
LVLTGMGQSVTPLDSTDLVTLPLVTTRK